MEELGLEALFVLTKINRQYLSGFTGSQGVLVVTPRDAALYVDDRYLIRARRETAVKVSRLDKLRARGRIGIEDRISLREFAVLKKKLPGRKWKVTSNVIENLRAVKTPSEMAAIRKGARIIDKIFWEIHKSFSPSRREGGDKEGVRTEAQVAFEIGRLAKKFGADGLAFDPIVAFGANAAAPHHNPGKDKIRKNNFLLLDFGVVVGGYHSDFTRTLFVGRPKRWQERMYNTVLGAQLAGIRILGNLKVSATSATNVAEVFRPPCFAKDVDAVVRNYIASAGYGKYFTHNSGHGVGLEIHELPNLSPDSEDRLRPGMVVTVEPGIYIEGKGGVRIEDMVLITERGPVVLSKVPKSFHDMIIKWHA